MLYELLNKPTDDDGTRNGHCSNCSHCVRAC
jgi:hypothetical protein